jgi:DNA repair exonuclease SbcCD ATPase subunit
MENFKKFTYIHEQRINELQTEIDPIKLKNRRLKEEKDWIIKNFELQRNQHKEILEEDENWQELISRKNQKIEKLRSDLKSLEDRKITRKKESKKCFLQYYIKCMDINKNILKIEEKITEDNNYNAMRINQLKTQERSLELENDLNLARNSKAQLENQIRLISERKDEIIRNFRKKIIDIKSK